MVLYVLYMNKTPVAVAEGKDAGGKLPSAADEHVVVNIAKLSPVLPERSSGVHRATQMAAVPLEAALLKQPRRRCCPTGTWSTSS